MHINYSAASPYSRPPPTREERRRGRLSRDKSSNVEWTPMAFHDELSPRASSRRISPASIPLTVRLTARFVGPICLSHG